MTDPAFQDDDLEFDDEFVLDDIELDDDMFENPARPQDEGPAPRDPGVGRAVAGDAGLGDMFDAGGPEEELIGAGTVFGTDEPLDEMPSAADGGADAGDPVAADPGGMAGLTFFGDPPSGAESGEDEFSDLEFDAADATAEEILSVPPEDGGEVVFERGAGFADDGAAQWAGDEVDLDHIVGEDHDRDLFEEEVQDESLGPVDALDDVEIEIVADRHDASSADAGDTGFLDEIDEGLEVAETAAEVDDEDPFADLELVEPERIELPEMDAGAFDLDGAETVVGPAAAAADAGPFGEQDRAQPGEKDWDLTLREDEPESAPVPPQQDWTDESYVLVDPEGSPDGAEPVGTGAGDSVTEAEGFGAGRHDTFFAAEEAVAGHERAMAGGDVDSRPGDGLDVPVFDGPADEDLEISDVAPEELEEELEDGIYGEELEEPVEQYEYGPDGGAELRELEEVYYEEEPEFDIQVVGGAPRRRLRFAAWTAAAAAVVLVGLGTVAILDPDRFGLGDDTPLVERIAVQRPQLGLEVPEPALQPVGADPVVDPKPDPIAGPGTDDDPPVDPDGRPTDETTPGSDPAGGQVAGGGEQPDDGPPDGGVPDDGQPDQLGPALPDGGVAAQPDAGDPQPTPEAEPAAPERPFEPLVANEELEIRGPLDLDPTVVGAAVEPGMRAWAQLYNEAVFVGTVRKIDASHVTLEVAKGEVTLERRELAALQPLAEANAEQAIEIEHGFVEVEGRGTLLGRVLRNEGSDAVVLAVDEGLITIPSDDLGKLGVRTPNGIVVVPDDDGWLDKMARQTLLNQDPARPGGAVLRTARPPSAPPPAPPAGGAAGR